MIGPSRQRPPSRLSPDRGRFRAVYARLAHCRACLAVRPPLCPPFVRERKSNHSLPYEGEAGGRSDANIVRQPSVDRWGPDSSRRRPRAAALALLLLLAGCSAELETEYGHVRGESLNGTGALAELFRARGQDVRAAVRFTDELEEWADVIVRFAPYPGPIAKDEAEWYAHWLDGDAERRLVYVVRDYDAQPDYWTEVLTHLPPDTPRTRRERVERRLQDARNWSDHLPPRAKETAAAVDWFDVRRAVGPPAVCKTLAGPWAQGVHAGSAALVRHDTLKLDAEHVLLKGDGDVLVMEWTRYNTSRVLVAANGSFLVNGALLNKARRTLAERLAAWADDDDEGLRVAFLEGRFAATEANPSLWSILRRLWEFRWIAFQMLLLGLAVSLARAARLGRPRPDQPSGGDRPVAHPEALGALLARSRQAGDARATLETYRRWRFSTRPSSEPGAAPTASETAPSRNRPFRRSSRES